MNWNKGYSASYYMTIVDSKTWRDLERIEIIDGSIKKDVSNLMQSADVTCMRYPRNIEQWVRIWLDAKQGETSEHVALFTGLAVSPDRDINGLIETNAVECYSVLKPADDILLERGWYAPEGFKGSALVRQLLSVVPAPIVEEDFSPSLASSIIAEDGETKLSMANKILTAINWRLKIDGDGTIHICSKPSEASIIFDALEMDIIEPKIKVSYDWYDCPNIFRAIEEDLIGIARDDSEDSPLSTVNRGREIWAEEINCKLNDGESVAEYAYRRLKEEQQRETSITYDRRFVPNIEPTDIVRLHLPAQNVDGDFVIESQSISLGFGAKVSEVAELWQK